MQKACRRSIRARVSDEDADLSGWQTCSEGEHILDVDFTVEAAEPLDITLCGDQFSANSNNGL